MTDITIRVEHPSKMYPSTTLRASLRIKRAEIEREFDGVIALAIAGR